MYSHSGSLIGIHAMDRQNIYIIPDVPSFRAPYNLRHHAGRLEYSTEAITMTEGTAKHLL